MKHYKYVFIDWYKTLSRSVFWEQFKHDAHPYHDVFEPIQKILFSDSSDVINQWMRGQLTSEVVVKQLGEALHLDPYILLKELILSCQKMCLMSENSLNLVTELRKMGIKVVIATDNMDTFQRWTVPSLRLDQYFDDLLSSFELKTLKADTDTDGRSLFFTPYLKSKGINLGEAFLLDDSGEMLGQIVRRSGMDYEQIEPGRLDAALERLLTLYP